MTTKVVDPRTGQETWVYDSTEYFEAIAGTYKGCAHEQTSVREWTNAGGGKAIVAQCATCGRRVGNPLSRRPGTPAADPAIAEAYVAQQKAVRDEIAIRFIDRSLTKDTAWWDRYNAYLKTPEWRDRAAKVRIRCGNVCEGCGSAAVDEIHHMTYDHVCVEFLFELVGLCHACHERVHAESPA